MLMSGSIAGWVQGAAVVLVSIMRAAAETASGTLIRASLVERHSAQEKDLLKYKTKKSINISLVDGGGEVSCFALTIMY